MHFHASVLAQSSMQPGIQKLTACGNTEFNCCSETTRAFVDTARTLRSPLATYVRGRDDDVQANASLK